MRDRNRTLREGGGGGRQSRGLWWVMGALGVVMALAVAGCTGGGKGEVQGTLSEPRQVGSVEAAATRIDLGQVPLNQWVSPTFRLRNQGVEPVTITVPRQGVETVEGC